MQHGTTTATKASGTKKLFAGIAALGLAAGAYGVYATTLTVSGSAGTNLQAGTSSAITPEAACDSDGMSVSESWADITLNGTTGYTTTTRQEWTVSGIADACIGDSLALAVKSVAGNGTAANTFVPIPVATVSDNGDANNNTVTLSVPEGYNNGVYAGNTPSDASVNRSAVTDTVGYSIKIS